MPFTEIWMQLKIIILTEVSQKGKDKYSMMWNLKYGTNKPIYETETNSQTQRTDLWLPRGQVWMIGNLRLVDANYCIWSG